MPDGILGLFECIMFSVRSMFASTAESILGDFLRVNVFCSGCLHLYLHLSRRVDIAQVLIEGSLMNEIVHFLLEIHFAFKVIGTDAARLFKNNLQRTFYTIDSEHEV